MFKRELASRNERIFMALAKDLQERQYIDSVVYEPETIELIPGFQGTLGYYKPVLYTPDFLFIKGESKIYIETKGFARGADRLKFILADKYYSAKPNTFYVVVTSSGTVKAQNRNFYLYRDKGIPSRGEGHLTKSFLEKMFEGTTSKTSRDFYERALAASERKRKKHKE